MSENLNGGGRSAAWGSISTSSSLLERVKAQEPEAWTRLVELYGPLVYYWCRKLGLQAHDAADVTQEVFSAVSSAIAEFERRDGGRFRGWLWTVARNKIRDHHRRQAGRAQAVGGSDAQAWLAQIPEPWADGSADETDRNETSSIYHRAIRCVRAEFEDRTWNAFWRVAIEGHAAVEVAADLGISPAGVRQAKYRVLHRLRAELAELGD